MDVLVFVEVEGSDMEVVYLEIGFLFKFILKRRWFCGYLKIIIFVYWSFGDYEIVIVFKDKIVIIWEIKYCFFYEKFLGCFLSLCW